MLRKALWSGLYAGAGAGAAATMAARRVASMIWRATTHEETAHQEVSRWARQTRSSSPPRSV
jgi:hypothetical protein